MEQAKIDELARQIRCYVHPVLIGFEADGVVNAILAWERSNPDVSGEIRERAWAQVAQLPALMPGLDA